MGAIYAISIIELFIAIMLTKKKEEKTNIIKSALTTIVLIMSTNIAECHALYFAKIKSTLVILSTINFIISTSLIIYSISKNKIQKYYLNKREFIPILIFLIITIIVGFLNFGIPANIKFETGDPYMHARAAIKYSQEDTLIFDLEDDFCDFRYWMTASYINTGLLINIFEDIVESTNYYTIYILFELFIFWISAVAMYYTLTKYAKTKFTKNLSLICTILYILGYPLNSLLFGFSYLSICILIINTIILFVEDYQEVSQKYFAIGLALLNYALFNAYYLFVPPVFLAELIYIICKIREKKQKLFTKTNILLILISMFIPGIMGCIQYVLRLLITNIGGIANWGYIYTNIYSNMIILLLFSIFVIIKKGKKQDYTSIFLGLMLVYTLLSYICMKIGIISQYYFAKNYYILWIAGYILFFQAFVLIEQKKDKLATKIFYVFLVLIIISFICNKTDLLDCRFGFNKKENITGIGEIYAINKDIFLESGIDITKQEIDFVKNAINSIGIKDKNTLILGTPEQICWIYSIFEYAYTQNSKETYNLGENIAKYIIYGENKELEQYIKNNDYEYIILLKRKFLTEENEKIKQLIYKTLEKEKTVYKNGIGEIIKNEK